jgi:hypothetical protein
LAKDPPIRRHLRRFGVAAAALLAACVASPPRTQPPVAAGQARIFVYRDNEPYQTLDWVPVTFNGRQVGGVGPGLFFYRDVAPGTYEIDVISQSLWPDQAKRVAARAGETIYAKVEVFRSSYATDNSGMSWPTYAVEIREPAVARSEMSELAEAVER